MHQTAVRLTSILDRAAPALGSFDEQAAQQPLLGGGWSAKQVLGHLIDSASNNHQRFVRAALYGGVEFPSYDQNGWSRIEAFQDAPWTMLVQGWTAANRVLVHVLAHLPAEAAGAPCRIGDNPPMSLADLARDYLRHMLHHLAQLGIAGES
jgi:hypothetical protein